MASLANGAETWDRKAHVPRARPQDDSGTFAAQLVALRPDLHKRALSLTHDRAAADDLVQDVLERALGARERFKHGTSLWAWLSTIQRNIFIDNYRQMRMVPCEVEVEWQAPEAETNPLDLLSVRDLHEAMETLGEEDRRILELACRDHLSYRQIAAILDIQPSTVGSRLFRVRQRLRPALLMLYWKRLRQGISPPTQNHVHEENVHA